ncbi:hypothetical protein [Ferrimonas marina]|uniref:Uncharacterized protein n=1 Tax=Ferrimonas marina TaxID=299255 RepID=A0A1M5U9X7_9GAMM|nr:hypothetical protein [Ferrimonas marina]SHH59708.1 hypothetical protein SAMN02745129_2468 [Ferrimonas marina]
MNKRDKAITPLYDLMAAQLKDCDAWARREKDRVDLLKLKEGHAALNRTGGAPGLLALSEAHIGIVTARVLPREQDVSPAKTAASRAGDMAEALRAARGVLCALVELHFTRDAYGDLTQYLDSLGTKLRMEDRCAPSWHRRECFVVCGDLGEIEKLVEASKGWPDCQYGEAAVGLPRWEGPKVARVADKERTLWSFAKQYLAAHWLTTIEEDKDWVQECALEVLKGLEPGTTETSLRGMVGEELAYYVGKGRVHLKPEVSPAPF